MGIEPGQRTEVLTDQKLVMERVLSVFSNAKSGLDILVETLAPPQSDQSQDAKVAAEAYFGIKSRGGRLRMLSRIDEKNVAYAQELMKNVELRHSDDVKGNFAVSETEYMSSTATTSFQPGGMLMVVYSNARPWVEQNRSMFERVWNAATPAEERVKELEEGVVQSKIEIVRDRYQIQKLYVDLIAQAKKEVLVILPTPNAFSREERIGVIKALEDAASERGVKVRIVAPDSLVGETLEGLERRVETKAGRSLINHRRILEATTPNTVTVLMVDGSASLILEQKDDSQTDFDKAIGVATYSTRSSIVLANVRFFESVWEDVELREREEVILEREKRSRKAAELLQDIMAHDIRNYNQISKISAEMLKADLQSTERLTLIDSILKATDGSSELIDRAKKLGRIISQAETELYPVDVEGSLQTSVALIIKSHPQRTINLSASVKSGAKVLADDLLEEAFTNILSNSVNYTETDEVPVEVDVQETEEAIIDTKIRPYWKITFTDHGRGVPDKMKDKIFTRYLNTATGAGLGLSIVYALVVERYTGKVVLADRVKGDFAKGTRVEVWLPKAP